MKRYSLLQEYEITEEDLTPVKDVSVHLVVSAKDIEEDKILKIVGQFANSFADLMIEESSQIEKGFEALNEKLMSESEKSGKRWFK